MLGAAGRLIIDTDPGIDDALALAIAFGNPSVDVLAVTTVAGNSPVGQTTANAQAVLSLLARTGVPLGLGAADPVGGIYSRIPDSPHGDDGLGDVDLSRWRRAVPPPTKDATALLSSVLEAAEPRSVDIAALGPLTNIADLLGGRPDLTDRVSRLVIMGGSSGAGNVTPTAEFNFWHDPGAAAEVLEFADLIDIVLVGLDVTRRATVGDDELRFLAANGEPGTVLSTMVRAYGDRPTGEWVMHDALVLAAIVDESVVSAEHALVTVVPREAPERGRTLVDFVGGAGAGTGPTIRFAVDVDVPKFHRIVLNSVASLTR